MLISSLNRYRGLVLGLLFVGAWGSADLLLDIATPNESLHLALFGVVAVVNALWGYSFGKVYEQMRDLSMFDPLTRALSRNVLELEVERLRAQSRRQARSFVVVVADLDGFKTVNDTQGHLAGDRLLRQAAGVFKETLRRSDVVIRYGGDEFVFLLPDTTREEAPGILARVAAELERVCHVKASTGIAVYPEDGESMDHLLGLADTQMYRQKHHSAALLSLSGCR